jgi:REP element-mobilizing transposase RayT
MQQIESLTYGNYYHIYNRGIDSCNLFKEPDNYEYFLSLYDKYISPVADSFAWVLMPNHFHFLIRVKEKLEIATVPSIPDLTGFENLSGLKEEKPLHQHFSNLFNAYTKAYNKRTGRHGSLFERPFKRKIIENKWYLKQVILYIHNNPVHHDFCSHPMEYPWSSYLTCVSVKPTKLHRDRVIGWFDNEANFKYAHNQKVEVERIEHWLEI